MTWKMFITFGVAWLITNGWSWVFLFLGPYLHLGWMTTAGAAWQTFLWMPFTIEKPFIFAMGVFLHKKIFKEDPGNINDQASCNQGEENKIRGDGE